MLFKRKTYCRQNENIPELIKVTGHLTRIIQSTVKEFLFKFSLSTTAGFKWEESESEGVRVHGLTGKSRVIALFPHCVSPTIIAFSLLYASKSIVELNYQYALIFFHLSLITHSDFNVLQRRWKIGSNLRMTLGFPCMFFFRVNTNQISKQCW